MNILITGAFGFVGSNLSKDLKRVFNCRLIALDILQPDRHQYDEFYVWNDLEKINWDKIDAIIHLAGKAHDTKNTSEEHVYFDINVGLTQKIFEYFLKSEAKKFIFFSSVKAVADEVSGDILTEDVVPAPIGPYGESKILAEKHIQNNWPAPSSGKSVYIIRPCMIHGPGNKGNLNLLYNVVKKGIPWPLGAFENRRSFTSIENLCFTIEGLIGGNVDSGIYNMADDIALSTNEIIDLICTVMGRKSRIWMIPQVLMKFIANCGGIIHLPLNPERLRKLTENYVVSNTKIKNALGVNQLPLTAQEGLKKTILSFKQK